MTWQSWDGEWYRPVRRGHKTICCDCGLVHLTDFKLVGRTLYIRSTRNDRSTALARRSGNYGGYAMTSKRKTTKAAAVKVDKVVPAKPEQLRDMLKAVVDAMEAAGQRDNPLIQKAKAQLGE